ncbi:MULTISPECIES: hypothetical protein [unclassified Streptomyces]|uniref:hypothetical protein n=1 Tax=unclassified Streptomyces TaxID=2593676 RepID=UPI0004C18A29|nr:MULTISPECIES: hypothetical protein [unclassified Streptomyces]
MNGVDPLWRTVQEGLGPQPPADFSQHPYVRWYMFNSGAGIRTDFLAHARQADPQLYEELRARYRAVSHGALEEPEPGDFAANSRTAQHFYYLTRQCHSFPDLSRRRICEIGGGYGNLMRMFVQLGLCASYTIVDIDRIVDIQRLYADSCLTAAQRDRVRILDIENPADATALEEASFDLVVSTFGLTEVPDDMRDWYLDRLVLRAPAVYLVGQYLWRGNKVGEQCLSRLGERFAVEHRPFVWSSGNEGPTFEAVGRATD